MCKKSGVNGIRTEQEFPALHKPTSAGPFTSGPGDSCERMYFQKSREGGAGRQEEKNSHFFKPFGKQVPGSQGMQHIGQSTVPENFFNSGEFTSCPHKMILRSVVG